MAQLNRIYLDFDVGSCLDGTDAGFMGSHPPEDQMSLNSYSLRSNHRRGSGLKCPFERWARRRQPDAAN